MRVNHPADALHRLISSANFWKVRAAPGAVVRTWQADPNAPSASVEYGAFHLDASGSFIDLDVSVEPEDASYDYSKLYYATRPDEPFEESRVICFRLHQRSIFHRVRLQVPDAARRSGFLRLRLDALPYTPGRVESRKARVGDGLDNPEASRQARLLAQKERVRAEVETSERLGRVVLPHYPESLSLELTAQCNLTCTHCSSHGDDSEHRMNNHRASFSIGMLERLAHEVFPHLTEVTLVGRGEPLMIGEPLWNTLTRALDEYRVLLSCVTNGYFLRRRITESVLPSVNMITVSIDGTTQDVFAENRGGGDLALVLRNVEHYHALRCAAQLARRPRLGFSWTLKRNNIRQFPDFIRMIKPFEPSLLYVRHLFIFREKDREQSLLGEPDLVNPYLREAYAMLKGMQVRLDVPPLMAGET